MEVKIEIQSIFGNVLFDFSKENNTIKDTIIEAVKPGAYLGSANLGGANLGGADLGEWGKIDSSADILFVGGIGSRNDATTIYNTNKGIYVKCGCFNGTLDEFVDKVKETHKGNIHERNYLALVEFAKIKFSDAKKTNP